MATEHIENKLKLLPDKPGCYLMKDVNGNVIYVGKSKNLKNRVRSYFKSKQVEDVLNLYVKYVILISLLSHLTRNLFC